MDFAARRDIPDVLGFEDFAAAPTITYQLVRDRLDRGSLFADHKLFPLPKQEKGTVRPLTVLNPLDEMALRAYVGRCSAAVAAATYEKRVLNGLIRRPGPGWYCADFREQSRKRRQLQRELYEDNRINAVGFFDVKKFFPTCRHDVLQELLSRVRAPSGAVVMLVGMLTQLFGTGRGLPIGFEGSGPLANLFLAPLDRVLLDEGHEFVRWTDDLDVFLRDSSEWPALRALVDDSLSKVRLGLNPDKTMVMGKGPSAENRLLDPGRDSLFVEDAIANIGAKLELDLWMREYGLAEDLPAPHFRSCLGRLRAARDPMAVEYLTALPGWIDREPRCVGDYFSVLAAEPKSRRAVDIDWLVDLAVGRTPNADTAAGQLHLFRALASYRVDKADAKRMLEFAWRRDVLARYPILGAWAVKAWSTSQGWNAREAVDLVDSIAHISYRRAAMAGFAAHGAKSSVNKLESLAHRHPEIRPVVAQALAA